MDYEKEKLIQNKGPQDNGVRQWIWKYIILSVSLFTLLIGGVTFTYIQTEWVQNKVKNDLFPHLSTQKSNESASACGITNTSDPVYKNYTIVQQMSARWTMYFNIAEHIPMFFANLVLNAYTDTYGRRFILILSMLGLIIKYTIVTAVVYTNASFWYVVLAYIIYGAMGSFYATLAGSFAYVADIITDHHNRVIGIVGIETIILSVSIIGGILSGYLVETINLGFAKTALICTCTSTLGLLMIICLVTESLPKSKRTPAKSILGTIRTVSQFYISSEFKGKRLGYILLLCAFFMATLSSGNRTSLEQLYLLGLPFCWGPSQIGTFLTARHGAQGVIGMTTLKLLQFCMSNEAIAILGPISNTVSFIIEGLATTDIMIYMVPVSGILSFIMIPLIRGIMSVITDPDKQGAMFSSIAALEGISSIGASVASNEIYAETYTFMHGFVFFLLAGLSFICCLLLVAYYVLKKVKLDQVNEINYKHVNI